MKTSLSEKTETFFFVKQDIYSQATLFTMQHGFWTNGFKREVPKRCSRKLSSSTNRLVNINPACNLSRGKNSNLYKRNNKLELTLNTKSKKQNLILILSAIQRAMLLA